MSESKLPMRLQDDWEAAKIIYDHVMDPFGLEGIRAEDIALYMDKDQAYSRTKWGAVKLAIYAAALPVLNYFLESETNPDIKSKFALATVGVLIAIANVRETLEVGTVAPIALAHKLLADHGIIPDQKTRRDS